MYGTVSISESAFLISTRNKEEKIVRFQKSISVIMHERSNNVIQNMLNFYYNKTLHFVSFSTRSLNVLSYLICVTNFACDILSHDIILLCDNDL